MDHPWVEQASKEDNNRDRWMKEPSVPPGKGHGTKTLPFPEGCKDRASTKRPELCSHRDLAASSPKADSPYGAGCRSLGDKDRTVAPYPDKGRPLSSDGPQLPHRHADLLRNEADPWSHPNDLRVTPPARATLRGVAS